LLFPAIAAKVSKPEPPPLTSPGEPASGLVLIVDDSETVRAVGRKVLEHAGFDVITAEDGAEAVKIIRERSKEIDCVVLDLTMPHMGGQEAFRKMRQIDPDIRVVLSSGYNEQEVVSLFSGKRL